MKRIGNLYEKVIAIDNLKLADEKARKGKVAFLWRAAARQEQGSEHSCIA